MAEEQGFPQFLKELRQILSPQYYPLLEYVTVKRFLSRSYKDRSGGINPTTARMYVRHVAEFCDFTESDPDKEIVQARSNPLAYKSKLENWFDALYESSDRDTGVGKIISVLAFLAKNGIEKGDMRYKRPQRKGVKERDYPWVPSHEDLMKAYDLPVWDSKPLGSDMRLYILAASQSGIAAEDLLSLDVNDVSIARSVNFGEDEYQSVAVQMQEGRDPIRVVIRRKGGQFLQITCLGKEVIDKMRELKRPHRGRLFDFPTDNGRTLRLYFQVAQDLLDLPNLSSHKLRRYFETTLEIDLHPKVLDRMMGHGDSGQVNARYSGLKPSQIEGVYNRVYEKLRLMIKPPGTLA